jgi:cytochrome c oxidase subunit II
MFGQSMLFPTQASTAAERVDALFFFLLGVFGFFTLLVAGLVIYFSVRYRRRPGAARPPRITGSLPLEVFWTVIPFGIAIVIFAWGARVYFYIAKPPAQGEEVYVVAKQWMWKLQHPEGQREINELHIPVGQPVILTLTSEDVIHSFFVPDFRTKVDVLPGRYVNTWFQATKPGTYDLFCSQYCGTNHSGMIGKVIVTSQSEYEAWRQQHAEGSLALEGRKLFLEHQCVSCHSANARARAPVLEGLYLAHVFLRDGTQVLADANYLRESILRPDAQVVAGFEPIMPTFQGQLTEEEIIKLIAFIKALEPGQTPLRIEDSPAPAVTPSNPHPLERP